MSLHCTPTGASIQIGCGATVLGSYSPTSTDPFDQRVARLAAQIMESGTITLDDEGCRTTFLHAAESGNTLVIRILLASERVPSENTLGHAVMNAINDGHERIVRDILSEGRTIPGWYIGNAVQRAVLRDHENILRIILSDGRMMPETHRSETILAAAVRGQLGMLEHLLQQAPISAALRNSALTQSTGPLAGAMRDILNAAPLIAMPAAAAAPAAAPAVTAATTAPAGAVDTSVMTLTFDDVRADPEKYLDAVCEYGMPARVRVTGESHDVVDLGGVTKQFITTLMGALLKKGILVLTGSKFPLAKDQKTKEALTKLGRFCSLLHERNEGRSDPFVTGPVFTPHFVELVQGIHRIWDPIEKCRCAAELLRDDSSAGAYAQVFLPADGAAAAASSAGTGDASALAAVLMCSEEEALEAAQEEIKAYVEAAEAFRAGMTDAFEEALLGAGPAAFTERLQGQPASKEAILAALQRDEGVPEAQFTWLRESITASDEAWRQKFLLAVTGNKTLPAGVTIRIARHWDTTRPVFELHTCFNSIHLPGGVAMGEEAFKAGLDAAITGAGYETA